MDEAGNTKDDLSLPKGTDDAEKLAQQIQEDFDGGKELVVTVLKVSSSSRELAPMSVILGSKVLVFASQLMHGSSAVSAYEPLRCIRTWRLQQETAAAKSDPSCFVLQSMGEEMISSCKATAGADK